VFPSTSTHTEPDGDRWFDLEVVASTEAGGVKLDALREEVKEFFAPAQFWEMSDDEKLSAPAGWYRPVRSFRGPRSSIRGSRWCRTVARARNDRPPDLPCS